MPRCYHALWQAQSGRSCHCKDTMKIITSNLLLCTLCLEIGARPWILLHHFIKCVMGIGMNGLDVGLAWHFVEHHICTVVDPVGEGNRRVKAHRALLAAFQPVAEMAPHILYQRSRWGREHSNSNSKRKIRRRERKRKIRRREGKRKGRRRMQYAF